MNNKHGRRVYSAHKNKSSGHSTGFAAFVFVILGRLGAWTTGAVAGQRIVPQQTSRQGISIRDREPSDRFLPSTLTTVCIEADVLLLCG